MSKDSFLLADPVIILTKSDRTNEAHFHQTELTASPEPRGTPRKNHIIPNVRKVTSPETGLVHRAPGPVIIHGSVSLSKRVDDFSFHPSCLASSPFGCLAQTGDRIPVSFASLAADSLRSWGEIENLPRFMRK
jgi:hypothetical protein